MITTIIILVASFVIAAIGIVADNSVGSSSRTWLGLRPRAAFLLALSFIVMAAGITKERDDHLRDELKETKSTKFTSEVIQYAEDQKNQKEDQKKQNAQLLSRLDQQTTQNAKSDEMLAQVLKQLTPLERKEIEPVVKRATLAHPPQSEIPPGPMKQKADGDSEDAVTMDSWEPTVYTVKSGTWPIKIYPAPGSGTGKDVRGEKVQQTGPVKLKDGIAWVPVRIEHKLGPIPL